MTKTLLAIMLGAAVTAAPVCADTAIGKAEVLRQLIRAGISRLPERAAYFKSNYPETVRQLELDLIAYRWVSRALGAPTDVKNLDAIIAALQKSLADPLVNYAAEQCSVSGRNHGAALLPEGNGTARDLAQLKASVEEGVVSREASPVRAAESFASAARLCQSLYLELTEAVLSKELGDLYNYEMSRYRQAESFYDRASSAFQAYRCAASTAVVYDSWGLLSATVARYADAAERYTQAARQWEELVRLDPSQFRNRDKAGLAYIRAGKAREAIGDYTAAAQLMRSHGLFQLRNWAYATKNYELLIKNLIIVSAFVRDRLKDHSDAVSLLNEARDAARLHGDPLLEARVYDELAKTYSSVGSTNAAAALLKRTKCLWTAAAQGDAAVKEIARQPGTPRGKLTRELARIERAAAAYEELGRRAKAAEMWRKAADLYGAADMIDEQLSCLRALAEAFDSLARNDEAFECRREAVSIARRSGRILAAADIVMRVIQTYRDENELQNALEGFNELVPLVLSGGNSRQAAEALAARGSLLAELRHYSEAARDFQAALDKYSTLVGDVWAAGEVALRLSKVQTAYQASADARAVVEKALANIESAYGFESARASYYAEHSRVLIQLYQSLIENHLSAKDEVGATQIVRRTLRYPWASEMMEDLRKSSDPIVAQFAQSNEFFRAGSQPTEVAGGSARLAKTGPEFVTACWKLQQSCPSSYQALPLDPLDLYKSRPSIPAETGVVVYMPTDFCIYAFICSRDMSSAWQLDRSRVDEMAAKLRRTIEYFEQGVGAGVPVPPVLDWQTPAFLELKTPLSALYDRLIAPIGEDLNGIRNIVFALPKQLEALPLQALVCGEREGRPEFLVQRFCVSYLMGGMLEDLTSDKCRAINPESDSLAIFADPEDNLPGARKEAAVVKNSYLNSRWYVGSERATASAFVTECRTAKILHIAAHHRISPNPFGVEIILGADSQSDGIVGLKELLNVPSSLELVVLSACDTVGSSDPVATGPTRAVELFSLVGAKSVLGAMWKVSDDAASQVFGEFYRNISKRNSRTQSLRLAQLSMIESRRFAHPFYWACFALYGNPR